MMHFTESSPRIAWQVKGASGPRVLLVMGFGMRGDAWNPQIDGLSPGCQVAWFDNRGIGQSERTTRAFSVRDLAGDALRVADALGWSHFHLVGVSLGGMIAQEVTLLAPERVKSLTLVATHAGGPLGVAPKMNGLVHWARAAFGPQSERVSEQLKLLYTSSFVNRLGREELRNRMQDITGVKPPRETALRQLWAVIRHDTRGRLKHITAPTLIVKPKSDILVRPFHSDVLARGIANSTLLEIEDTGHGVTFQNVDQVNAAIRSHVTAHE